MATMRLKQLLLSTWFLATLLCLSGKSQSQNTADSLLLRATQLSAIQEIDSSNALLSTIDTNKIDVSKRKYVPLLNRFNNREELSYTDYRKIAALVYNANGVTNKQKVDFMMNRIPVPQLDTLPRDYMLIQFSAMNIYLNLLPLEDAAKAQNSLKALVQEYDPTHHSTLRARVLLLNYDFTLAQINGNNPELMYAVYSEMDSLSNVVKDPFLLALSEYVAMAFYTTVGDLNAFLEAGEKCLAIARTDDAAEYLVPPSLEYLLNGYIYQAENFARIQELITELDGISSSRWLTYVVYAQYIRVLPQDSPEWNLLFNKFSASNFFEFVENLSQIASSELEGKDLLDYYETLANSLSQLGHKALALDYASKANILVKKIYTEEMASSIARVETDYALKAKNAELEKELEIQEVYQTTLIIGGFIVAVLVLLVFYIWKQNTQLNLKNTKIEEQKNKLEKSEKEIALLLKEVHHRVKNNFQIISSLLELQYRNVEDEETQSLLQEGKNRVQSMAFIHQQLYENDELHINFKEYVPKLINELGRAFGVQNLKTELDVPSNLSLDIDTAIPLGLILNELITNSMKYGFGDSHKLLKVSIMPLDQGEYELALSDNGNGLPENFDWRKAKSMGLRLVNRLSKQLHGTVLYDSSKESKFTIQFKDAWARKQVD